MDEARARELLAEERGRVTALLAGTDADTGDERASEAQPDAWGDAAQPLTSEGEDDAVAAGLRDRLGAIGRAEARLSAGTYGRSVRSGRAIPDERLEADPAAELTVDEATRDETGGS